MFRLRHPTLYARQLARWVLVCFALSIGLAIAAPLANPQSLELVCSTAGNVKLLVKAPDGSSQVVSQMGDCPLCLTAGAPPPMPHPLRVAPAQALSYLLRPTVAAPIAIAAAAPLPARGPPVSI